jgi:predicted permease
LINEVPLGGGGVSGETPIEGRVFPEGQIPVADKRIVSPGYFSTMGIRLIRGRAFSEDDRAGAMPVAIVSELYAQRYFSGEDPIGRRVSIDWEMEGFQQIVGVVGDVRHEGLDAGPAPTIYVSYHQRPSTAFSVVVKSEAPAHEAAAALRDAVRNTDASRPVDAIRTLDELVDASIAPRRLVLQVIVAFALVALTLAAVGVYGVASGSAQGRMREIGVRVALGAQGTDIVTLILRRHVVVTSVGIAAGLGASLAARRFIDAYLFEVASTDGRTRLAAALLLGGISLIAAYLPIRRTLRMSPARALDSASH